MGFKEIAIDCNRKLGLYNSPPIGGARICARASLLVWFATALSMSVAPADCVYEIEQLLVASTSGPNTTALAVVSSCNCGAYLTRAVYAYVEHMILQRSYATFY